MGREQLLFEVIRSVGADVILLQELNSPEFLQDLAQKLAMPHSFFAPANRQILRLNGSVGLHRRNIGLLSRYPIISASYHKNFPVRRTILEADIEYTEGQSFKVFGIHLLASLSIVSELWRVLEINALLQYLKPYQTEKCLIVGDFNTIARGDFPQISDFPPHLQTIVKLQGNRVYARAIPKLQKQGWTDCYRTLHPTANGYTLPAPKPNTRLDYIFANPALAADLQHCEVVTGPAVVNAASDHLPVLADFTL